MNDLEALVELLSHEELMVDLTTDAGTFQARSLKVREALSELTHATAEVLTTGDTDFEELLEGAVTVTIRVGPREVRRWSLVLGDVQFIGMAGGMLRYRFSMYPAFWLLGFTKDVRKWRDQTPTAIIDSVLDRYGIVHRWENTRAPESRPWTVQYRESCLAFVSRLLEFEGIYYSFEEDGTMVLGDRSSASPEVQPLPFTLLDTAGAMSNAEIGITTFRRGTRVGSGAATVNDYNMKTASTSLLASSQGSRDSHLEVYDYPVGYRTASAGATLATLRREALEATKVYATGKSNVFDFAPARAFHFFHEEGLSYSGSYVLVRTEHEYLAADAARGHQRASYSNSFFAIPEAVPFRPPLATPRPTVEGNHTVMVRGPEGEEIHTDDKGRFKVQFHWDREAVGTDADSRWLRMNQEVSTSLQLARVGWENSVAYIDGDPDRPIGFARNINGEMTPTYGQPARKNVMTIKTESYPGKVGFNELRMDDSAGVMRFDVRAERDFSNNVLHDKTERVGVDHHHTVKLNRAHQVQKTQTVTVGSNSVTMIGQNHGPNVRGNRQDTVAGSEKVKIGNQYTFTVGDNDSEKVGGLRISIVGGVQLPDMSAKAVKERLTGFAKDQAKGAVSGAAGAAFGATAGEAAAGAMEGGGKGALEALRGGAESRLAKAGKDLSSTGFSPFGSLSATTKQVANAAVAKAPPTAQAALGALGAFKSGGASAVAAAAGFKVPKSGEEVGKAIQGAIPNPSDLASGALSAATGGLSDKIKSPESLLELLHGSISRRGEKRFNRMVGGAEIKLAGGNISHNSGLLLAETVGGVKATITLTGGIDKSVKHTMVNAIGVMALRKAKSDYNTASNKTDVRVGGNASFKAGEMMELRSKHIELEAAGNFTLKSGDVEISMSPGGMGIKGTMKFEAGSKINVIGGPDDLTG
jgi:type VI secretion system secreted protein VgrG